MTTSQHAPHPKMLVALDGSPAAATALPLARAVARVLHTSVEILHVAAADAPDPVLWGQFRAALVPGEALRIHAHAGDAASVILQVAAEPDVGLLILTTHGRLVEPGRALGSVAEAVIARTIRPVLLVRPEAPGDGLAGAPVLRRLLLPLDGTPTTAGALRPATELALRLEAALDLLYVAGPASEQPEEPGSLRAPQYVDQPQHEWPEWAREVTDRLCRCLAACPPGVPVQVYLARGEIGEAIARFAAEHQADAIVLVRRSHLQVGRARVLRAVLDRTPCPVLLVSGSGDEPAA